MAAASALLIGSTAFSAGSSFLNASNQSSALLAQGEYQQQIAQTNARALDDLAKDAIERGKYATSLVRRRTRQLVGTQRAGYAGQGVDVGSGTAINVQDETYTLGETDALTVKNNAWREAWGYKTQAVDLRNQGRLAALQAKLQAKNTMLTGGISSFGSILSGGYQYMNARQSTSFVPRNPTEEKFNNYYK